jgi:hypothetical protein
MHHEFTPMHTMVNMEQYKEAIPVLIQISDMEAHLAPFSVVY